MRLSIVLAAVAFLLPVRARATSQSGSLNGAAGNVTGTMTAGYFVGNGAGLTNVPSTGSVVAVISAYQTNISTQAAADRLSWQTNISTAGASWTSAYQQNISTQAAADRSAWQVNISTQFALAGSSVTCPAGYAVQSSLNGGSTCISTITSSGYATNAGAAASVPASGLGAGTISNNTTGTASNVTGVVATGNGGTGNTSGLAAGLTGSPSITVSGETNNGSSAVNGAGGETVTYGLSIGSMTMTCNTSAPTCTATAGKAQYYCNSVTSMTYQCFDGGSWVVLSTGASSGGGSGNVSSAGTPVVGALAQWQSGTSISSFNVFGATNTWTAPQTFTSTATLGGLLNLASPSGGTGFSANSPGYTYLPNGLILQWGSYLGTMSHGSYYNPTFPIAFPHACLGVNFTVQSNQTTTGVISYAQLVPGDISTTGFEFQWGFSTGGSAPNCGIWWTAVGY